jgi:hypothetical protein
MYTNLCANTSLQAGAIITMPAVQLSGTRVMCVRRYAAKVAKGYRPSKPKAISAATWQLIEACWQQEPCARPSMAKVRHASMSLFWPKRDTIFSKSYPRTHRCCTGLLRLTAWHMPDPAALLDVLG